MDDAREKVKHKIRLRYGLSYAEPTDEQFNKIMRDVKDLRSQGLDATQIEVKLDNIVQKDCQSYRSAHYAEQDPHILIKALMDLLDSEGGF
jgi:hypothetical protein